MRFNLLSDFYSSGKFEILDLDICFITNVFSCMASRIEQQISILFSKVDLSPTGDVGVRDHLNQLNNELGFCRCVDSSMVAELCEISIRIKTGI